MTSSLKRVVPTLAAVVMALGLSGCGDDDGSGRDASSGSKAPANTTGSADSPEAAYAAFAQAIRDEDADAFDAAVYDGYWSDLTEAQDDDEVNLASHHWTVENGVMSLPDDPEVEVGAAAFGSDLEPGAAQSYVERLAGMTGLDDATAEDLAIATVVDGIDSELASRAQEKGCIDKDQGIEECLGQTAEAGDREDVAIIMLRGKDGWRVFGTEPAN